MAGFFAAAAKTPFSTLIIVSEMTGDYNLLLPALWVCTIAFLVSDEQSLYQSQVKSRALSPAHQGSYVREVLAGLKVSDFLLPGVAPPMLHLEDPLAVGDRPADAVPAFPCFRWSMSQPLAGDGRAGRGPPGRPGRHRGDVAAGRRPDAPDASSR